MNCDSAINFLKNHSFFHDSIIDSILIKNSAYIDKKRSIVFGKNNWNDVEMLLSSQKGYKIKIVLKKVYKMQISEFYEVIIFKAEIKSQDGKILFSPTGGFVDRHIWFEAEEIFFEELK